jgi:hypothetical protein
MPPINVAARERSFHLAPASPQERRFSSRVRPAFSCCSCETPAQRGSCAPASGTSSAPAGSARRPRTERTVGFRSTGRNDWRRSSSGVQNSDPSRTYSAARMEATSRIPKRPGRRFVCLRTASNLGRGAAWNQEQVRRIDLHWHDLLHEGACRLLADAVDIRIIQLMLGHASIQQTQRYFNVKDEERVGGELEKPRATASHSFGKLIALVRPPDCPRRF